MDYSIWSILEARACCKFEARAYSKSAPSVDVLKWNLSKMKQHSPSSQAYVGAFPTATEYNLHFLPDGMWSRKSWTTSTAELNVLLTIQDVQLSIHGV